MDFLDLLLGVLVHEIVPEEVEGLHLVDMDDGLVGRVIHVLRAQLHDEVDLVLLDLVDGRRRQSVDDRRQLRRVHLRRQVLRHAGD